MAQAPDRLGGLFTSRDNEVNVRFENKLKLGLAWRQAVWEFVYIT